MPSPRAVLALRIDAARALPTNRAQASGVLLRSRFPDHRSRLLPRLSMKPDSPKYELPVPGTAWFSKVELGAGIFYLEGRTYVAGHSSPAERQLLERGAFLLASLRFEPELLEGSHPGRTVEPLATRGALQRLGEIAWRN